MQVIGHTGMVRQVVFSPDGTLLATASFGGGAKLWDPVSGKELFTLSGHLNAVYGVDFRPDGSHLAVASRDGTNRIYLLKIEDLVALARQRVTRILTLEECQQYLHMDTYPSAP